MSRHGKFYSQLKNGDYDDDDDYYDEDEYYEEEEVAPGPSAKQPPAKATPGGATPAGASVAVTPPAASSTATTPTTSTLDTNGIDTTADDYELLALMVPELRQAVGPMQTVKALVDALRETNYDVDAALAQLKKAKKHVGKTIAIASPVPGQAPSFGPVTDEINESPSASSAQSPATAGGQSATPTGKSYDFKTGAVHEADGKTSLTLVIAGHVDSGKSTILGHLLLRLGMYTDADVRRNESEGAATGKQSFRYAWLLDRSEEERRRGVTIDSGAHAFITDTKRVTVLDAPGHADFVTNMISSATQADCALLVLTARKGEFESGLQHGTREHLTILRMLGVRSIVVAVNKMDLCDYDSGRFEDIRKALAPVLAEARFEESAITHFVPVSGIEGTNLVDGDRDKMPWYGGPSLLRAIDQLPAQPRFVTGPLRASVQDVQRSLVYARIEAGKVKKGETIVFVPSNIKITVKSITLQSGAPVTEAIAGTSVEISTNSDLTGVCAGDVGCSAKTPITATTDFEATTQFLPVLPKAVLPGTTFTIVIHAMTLSVTVVGLKSRLNAQTGQWVGGMVKAIPPGSQAILHLRTERPIAVEVGERLRALGVFVLRQDGLTVGGGVVQKLLPPGSAVF